jgi:hypothetical protein
MAMKRLHVGPRLSQVAIHGELSDCDERCVTCGHACAEHDSASSGAHADSETIFRPSITDCIEGSSSPTTFSKIAHREEEGEHAPDAWISTPST